MRARLYCWDGVYRVVRTPSGRGGAAAGWWLPARDGMRAEVGEARQSTVRALGGLDRAAPSP